MMDSDNECILNNGSNLKDVLKDVSITLKRKLSSENDSVSACTRVGNIEGDEVISNSLANPISPPLFLDRVVQEVC